jgi:hypothetical protein
VTSPATPLAAAYLDGVLSAFDAAPLAGGRSLLIGLTSTTRPRYDI